MAMLLDGVSIRHVCGHYEAYIGGKFMVSGDTVLEVVEELQKIEEEQFNGN